MFFRRTPQSATEWIVRLQAGPLSWRDRRALTRWVSARPERLAELDAAQAVNEFAQGLSDSARARALLAGDLRARAAPESRQRIVLPALAAAAVAALIVVAVEPWNAASPARMDARTAVGEIAEYQLFDRSQVTVAGASAISVAFTQDRRDVSLERGEAFFDVRPDAARPFVVTAGPRKVTVTGTSFNVNYLASLDEMEVAVVEGAVQVAFPSRAGGQETEHMRAGDVILFRAEGPLVRRNLTPQQVSAWRSRKLFFDSATLSQVLAEVNRYSAKPVICETRDIERLMLTGQFEAGDVESVLISLRQLYGIEAQETNEQWVLARKDDTRR